MIKGTFNKPAVDAHFPGLGATVQNVEVRLKDDAIAFRGSSEDVRNNVNVMSIEVRERGGAVIEFNGRLTDQVGKVLTNPYGNPFFLLERRDGWVVPVPFFDRTSSHKGEPGRTVAHLRVWPGRGMPLAMSSNHGSDARLRDSIRNLKLLHSFHQHGQVNLPIPQDVKDAADYLSGAEKLIREVYIPLMNGDRPIDWFDPDVFGSLQKLMVMNAETLFRRLSKRERLIIGENEDVPEGEDEIVD